MKYDVTICDVCDRKGDGVLSDNWLKVTLERFAEKHSLHVCDECRGRFLGQFVREQFSKASPNV